jgi:hypothetical protein
MLLPVSAPWFSGIGSGGFTAFAPRRHARGMLRRQKRRDPAEPDAGAVRYTGGHRPAANSRRQRPTPRAYIAWGSFFIAVEERELPIFNCVLLKTTHALGPLFRSIGRVANSTRNRWNGIWAPRIPRVRTPFTTIRQGRAEQLAPRGPSPCLRKAPPLPSTEEAGLFFCASRSRNGVWYRRNRLSAIRVRRA